MYSHVVSLGQTCATAFQLRRFDLLRAAGRREQPRKRESFLFDWQFTPLSTVVKFIELDFVGIFERSDLRIKDGRVINTRFSTSHMHQFTPQSGGLSEADVQAQYLNSRSRQEYLAEKMRSLFNGPGPVLYVVSGHPDIAIERLVDALSRYRAHAFHIALFLTDDIVLDLPDDARVSRHAVAVPQKPADQMWEGDDASWLRALGELVPRSPGERLHLRQGRTSNVV